MSQLINDQIRKLRREIRALGREAEECYRRAEEPHLLPEYVARCKSEAREAQALIIKKEDEMEALRKSVQLNLF